MAHYDDLLQARLRRLGERVRAERIRLGMSQEELAHSAGLHRTYVGSVERGERNISIGSLFVLADTMKVQPTSLLPE